MDRLFKVLTIFLVVIFLCSCSVKNDNSITISKDGKVNYSVLIGIDRQLLASLKNNNVLDENNNIDISDYVSANMKDGYLDGFKKEKYSDNEYIGNKYTYVYESIDDVTSSIGSKVYINDNNSDELLGKDLFTKNNDVYSANLVYSLVDKDEYDEVNFINTFSVNLPRRNISNNADKVVNSGKTLIWNIKNGEEKNIKFSFKLNDNKGYLVIASLIFDIDIIIAIIILRRKVI